MCAICTWDDIFDEYLVDTAENTPDYGPFCGGRTYDFAIHLTFAHPPPRPPA